MIREITVDEYFSNQPKRKFEKDLRKYEFAKIRFEKNLSENRVSPKAVCLDKGVFAKKINLRPVWYDFEKFLEFNGILGDEYTVYLKKQRGYEFEEYQIDIREDCIIITAGEIEGIRRAIIKLEDMLVASFGNLEKGVTREKTIIKRRISRSFFAPINRPPKGAEELGDDTDYYPEAYLNRMMHQGVNAIWVYSDFDALVDSTYIPEFGKGREKRIAKLNKLIKRCKKYGIDVFMFLIAPMSLFEPAIANKYPGIAEKYPQVHGYSNAGPTAFCVYTEFGAGYLKEASENLMKAAPGLGGIMSITCGERVTSCGNAWGNSEGKWINNCPHCSDKSSMDSVTRTVALFKDGMDAVNPDFDFISWTYGMRGRSDSVMEEYFQKISKNAISMVNFEDDGRVYQLGKKRFAFDYYLCYSGPSQMYKKAANFARKYNKELYAKMQICCSHELATVPYIPVPGIIYDKMVGAKQTGTTGIMECWFFGSYPCLMSKVVGMLSGDKEYKTKQEFLFDLAKLYWKESEVPYAVSAWEYFEKAYKAYPVNVMFNYYGPMHDGIVWDLALKPRNFSLPRTWQLIDRTDGDKIGECMFYGHTLDELITLSEEICFNWQKGCEQLAHTEDWTGNSNEQINIAKALLLLFNSGLNVLKFYRHRQNIGYGRADYLSELNAMKKLVKAEIENSKKMIPLCKADNRLGWHSEAEGYKFHPEKLNDRIEKLQKLLNTDFLEVEERILNGLEPLSYYHGEEEGIKRATAGRKGIESAEWITFGCNDGKGICSFRIAEKGEEIQLELKAEGDNDNFYATFETELMYPQNTYIFKNDGTVRLWREGASHQGINDERAVEFGKKWKVESLSKDGNTHLLCTITKKDLNFIRFPFKLSLEYFKGAKWQEDSYKAILLGKNKCQPSDFGWID